MDAKKGSFAGNQEGWEFWCKESWVQCCKVYLIIYWCISDRKEVCDKDEVSKKIHVQLHDFDSDADENLVNFIDSSEMVE